MPSKFQRAFGGEGVRSAATRAEVSGGWLKVKPSQQKIRLMQSPDPLYVRFKLIFAYTEGKAR